MLTQGGAGACTRQPGTYDGDMPWRRVVTHPPNGSLNAAMTPTASTPTTSEPTPRQSHLVLWWALTGVVAVVLLALVAEPRIAGLVLAGHLLVLGGVRAFAPGRGPYGIASRSRAFDTTFLALGALGIAVLSLTADNL